MNIVNKNARGKYGLTLAELLCIIAIMLAFYAGAIAKAFLHVKHQFGK
jgi:Tfp pilus assembly protein FimT